MATEQKKKSRRGAYIALTTVVVALLCIFLVFGPNTGKMTQGEFLYIHTGANYDQVAASLEEGGFINSMTTFRLLARVLKLPTHIHPGKYRITKGMGNYNIVRLLRSGRQTPVKLVINRLRTRHDFVNLLSSNLEADSATLNQLFSDNDYLEKFGLDTNTVMCAVMQDTYDFYWNTTADKAFRKIEKNYVRFWDETRKQQAQQLGLTPKKTVILASIVDEETNMNEDKPKIASVYLNRLKAGMKLDADPTVKFAIGDFTIRRVAGPMLQNPSPYNTYANEGLPPGPICTPAVSSIEAVLEAPATNYLYFCAKSDFSGYSTFAATFAEQQKNARDYQKALDSKGIH